MDVLDAAQRRAGRARRPGSRRARCPAPDLVARAASLLAGAERAADRGRRRRGHLRRAGRAGPARRAARCRRGRRRRLRAQHALVAPALARPARPHVRRAQRRDDAGRPTRCSSSAPTCSPRSSRCWRTSSPRARRSCTSTSTPTRSPRTSRSTSAWSPTRRPRSPPWPARSTGCSATRSARPRRPACRPAASSARRSAPRRPAGSTEPADAVPLHAGLFMQALAERLPADAIVFDEALTTSPEVTRYLAPERARQLLPDPGRLARRRHPRRGRHQDRPPGPHGRRLHR